jgi:hypothetical protein
MRIAAGLPSISAGSKTKRRAASSAAESKARPADSVTRACCTDPPASMASSRTTVAVRAAAFSLSGYVASTKWTSRGGFVSLCGLAAGPSSGGFEAAVRVALMAARSSMDEASRRRLKGSRGRR